MNTAQAFTRIIRWSDEDNCYIGSLPEIAPNCCHGKTTEEVAALLDDIAATSLLNCKEHGIPYDPPGAAIVIIPQAIRNQDTTLEWDAEDETWVARAPELPGCTAFGSTQTEALQELQTAIPAWIAAAQESGYPSRARSE